MKKWECRNAKKQALPKRFSFWQCLGKGKFAIGFTSHPEQ